MGELEASRPAGRVSLLRRLTGPRSLVRRIARRVVIGTVKLARSNRTTERVAVAALSRFPRLHGRVRSMMLGPAPTLNEWLAPETVGDLSPRAREAYALMVRTRLPEKPGTV